MRGKRLKRGAKPLSYLHSPLPLIREGGQGDRLLNNFITRILTYPEQGENPKLSNCRAYHINI